MYMNQLILALMVNSMELNVQEWKEIQIGRLFDIYPTKAYAGMSNDELNDGGATPFIINSAENNGIGGFCSLPATEKGNIITFSDTTDGNTFFYQPDDFIGFAHVQGMHPKGREWNKYQMIFMTAILMFHNRGLFNYGRKMRRDVISSTFVKVPVQHNEDGSLVIDANKNYSDDGYVPDWEFMEDYIKSLHCESITTQISGDSIPDLEIDKWEEFRIGTLFELSNGKNKSASDLEDGNDINYIGAKRNDNGVMNRVKLVHENVSNGNCVIFICNGQGSVGYSIYMDKAFIGTADIVTGYNENINSSIGLFIATVASLERPRYSFGRKWKKTLSDTLMKLPIHRDEKGNPIIDNSKKYSEKGYIPDWEFMENYIKSLPYSDRI